MIGMKRRLSALLGICLLGGAAQAPGISQEEAIERVQTTYEQTGSWEARFTEVSVNRSLGIELDKHGRAYFRKPGLMRWEYELPDRRLIVSDGEHLWVYSPDDEQVLVASIESLYRAHAPILFLTGEGKLTDYFDVSLIADKEAEARGEVVLELMPREQQANLAKLKMVADAESFQIVGTVVYDHFGNTADIRFCDIRMDRDLPADLFEFSVPPGTEVIEASEFGREQ